MRMESRINMIKGWIERNGRKRTNKRKRGQEKKKEAFRRGGASLRFKGNREIGKKRWKCGRPTKKMYTKKRRRSDLCVVRKYWLPVRDEKSWGVILDISGRRPDDPQERNPEILNRTGGIFAEVLSQLFFGSAHPQESRAPPPAPRHSHSHI